MADNNDWSGFPTADSAAPTAPPSPPALKVPTEDDPWSAFPAAAAKTTAPTFVGALKSAATGLPGALYEGAKTALSDINSVVNPSPAEALKAAEAREKDPSKVLTDWTQPGAKLAEAAGAIPSAVVKDVAPVVAAPMTSAIQAVGEPLAKKLNPDAVLPSREDVYGKIEPEVEEAAGLIMPRDTIKAPAAVPAPPPEPPLGVTLSEGQATGDLPTIQREQAALRGQSGPEAQRHAQDFADQQKAQVEAAKESTAAKLDPFNQSIAASPQEAGDIISNALSRQESLRNNFLQQEAEALTPVNTVDPLDAADTVGQSLRNSADTLTQSQEQTAARLQNQHEEIRSNLNPTGAVLAENPQEASEIISAAVTRAEEQAREARDAAYEAFRNQEGTFDPRAFRDTGNAIKRSLNLGDDPVILNDKTTPMASAAIQDVDDTLGAPARAALSPETTSYKPFTPSSVDDARKRLVAFSRQANATARATNDFSDVRAMRRITDAFDDLTQGALRDPDLFSGDGEAVADTIENARGLHADLRNTFSRQGSGDKVGPIMQQIVGQREGQAAPPNQIAQWLYGTGQTPVLVARRLLSLFGADSPETAALKQGLFSHITERPEGVTAWGPEQVADRVYDFLNGRGRSLSQAYFSPEEQAGLWAYADRLRASVAPPPAPTDVVTRALNKINGVGGQGATSAELADTLFGRSGIGENPLGAKLAQHVRDTYGPDSEPFESMRQGMFSRLTASEGGRLGFDPESIADKIDSFLGQRGRPMAETLYSPEERAQLKNYADALRQHAEHIGGSDNEVDRTIAKIVGRDGAPATAREVADLLYSRSVARDRNLSVNLARRLKDQFGESSPQWSAVKQGLFRQLVEPGEGMTDWGPGKIAQRLNKFLNVDGKETSEVLFSPDDRAMLRNYADMMRKLEVPQAGANWSNTATFMARAMNNIGGKVGMVVGAALGRAAMPFAPPLVSEAVGAGAANAAGRLAQRIQARAVAKQMPLVANQIQKWQRAVAAVARANTPSAKGLALAATTNLSHALSPLGIDLRSLAQQGPGTAESAPDKDHVPRPPSEQKDGGRVSKKRGAAERAKGGAVDDIPEHQNISDWLNNKLFGVPGVSSNDRVGVSRETSNGNRLVAERADGGQVSTVIGIDDPLVSSSSSEPVGITDLSGMVDLTHAMAPNGIDTSGFRPSDNIEDVRDKPDWRKAVEWVTRKPLPGDQTNYRAHGGRVDASNINQNPTEGQKSAGNYAKDHLHFQGLPLTIENAKGLFRGGIDKGGKAWKCKLPAHYGYIKRTEGADGDHVDVYVGPHRKAQTVFIIDQVDSDTGKFDEVKCMLGFGGRAQAVATYKKCFSDGKGQNRIGFVSAIPIALFKHWLKKGDTRRSFSSELPEGLRRPN